LRFYCKTWKMKFYALYPKKDFKMTKDFKTNRPTEVYFIPASAEEPGKILTEKTKLVYDNLGLESCIEPGSFVAMKIHFGEKGTTGYIRPAWLSGIIKAMNEQKARAFFTDTNTLYVGNRSNSVDHVKLAHGHGFAMNALGVPVIIADGLIGRDGDEVRVDLPRIKSAKIASAFLNSDVLLCLSHFTGHIQMGLAASLKNLGMGCASRAGKLEQHSDVHPWIDPMRCEDCGKCLDYCPEDALTQENNYVAILDEKCIGCGECMVVCPVGAVKWNWDGDENRVQEKMAEYALGVFRLFDGRAGFINYLVRITKDCDCMSKKAQPISEDIGILGSRDPVALDQASADLVLGRNKGDVLRRANDMDWEAQLRHAENIGLGTRQYKLITLGL